MHFRVNAAIVGLLVNDESFRACLDNRHIIFRLDWAYFDGNRRKIGSQSAHAFGKILVPRKFWVLARDEKNLPKSLASEMLRFGDHFVDIKRDAKDWIVTRETAIPAVNDP